MSNQFIENEKLQATNSAAAAPLQEPTDISAQNISENHNEEESHGIAISTQEQNVPNIEDNEPVENTKEEVTRDEWADLLGSGAIMKKILREGTPNTRPERNEKCTINYTCYLDDETIVETVSGFEMHLGESDVIQGLDVAIGLMNVDEKCRLKLQPRLAYGKIGLPPNIPGDSVVIYDIELVSVHPEDDIDTVSIQERKMLGNKKRERGNWWYMRGENNIAIQCYRRALDYLDFEGGISMGKDGEKKEVSDTELQSLLEDRISVCNNMAAAQIKMELWDNALNSLEIVLRCKPDNIKAHFRKAKIYLGKNDLPTAMKCLQKAKELSPNDPEIQKEINFIAKKLEKQKIGERELARRMLNGPKKFDGQGDTARKYSKKNKLGVWTTVGAVVAVGVAGFVAYRFKYI